MKKHATAAGIFCFSLALDIVTKALAVRHIGLHERIDVLESFVQLTLLYNRGGLFGILQGYQSFFLVISIAVLALLVVYYVLEKHKTALFRNAIALVMSGAVGNILDRLTGRPGVVDFIYIGDDAVFRWPAFNVADAAIVVGALLLLVFYYREEARRKAMERAGQ